MMSLRQPLANILVLIMPQQMLQYIRCETGQFENHIEDSFCQLDGSARKIHSVITDIRHSKGLSTTSLKFDSEPAKNVMTHWKK